MSLDTTVEASLNGSQPLAHHALDGQSALSEPQWAKLQRSIIARAAKITPSDVFGAAAEGGCIYRWGFAVSVGGPCGDLVELLSRLAVDAIPKKTLVGAVDIATSVEVFIDSVTGPTTSIRQNAIANLWAGSLPSLVSRIDSRLWWDLVGTLQQLRESTLQLNATSSPAGLMIGGELGLTLAWRLADLPSCKRMSKSSIAEVNRWFADEDDSIAAIVSGGTDIRLALASIIRCQRLLQATQKTNLKKRQLEIAADVAVWAASMTMHQGPTAFSSASSRDVRDDTAVHGLLREAMKFDTETLSPSVSAALGESRSGGKLAWQVSLPEAMQHSDNAKFAVMLPEWDVRRGRVHIDYSGEDTAIEMFVGKHQLVGGDWQVMIEVDGDEQQAKGDWVYTCEYTDDDVHYLEIEQPWSGGVTLQRQFMLVREDRCVLIADTVVTLAPSEAYSVEPNPKPRKIRYTARLPLTGDLKPEPENETREIYFGDGKRRALVIPLAANEWRVGPTAATLKTDDESLVLDTSGFDSLYAPLWFDFQSRRFSRPRTWRQLTIVDELRLVRSDEAAGYRIQLGSEQWLVYRSLGARRVRSLLGKHLIADFFSGRFDPENGNIDELVTVDDSESFDD